jgi:predicted nucleic acid-binding protein
MAEAMIYATALDSGAQLVTSDAHFKGLAEVTFIALD